MTLSLTHIRLAPSHYAVIYGGNEIGHVAKVGSKWIAKIGQQEIGQGDRMSEADMILVENERKLRLVVAS